VNPHTDHRPTDHTVTKETTRMTPLSQRLTSVVSSIFSFGNRKPATRAEDAQDGAGQGRSEGVCSAHDRMRTLACAVLGGALLLVFVSPAVSSAQVAPWWGLNTSVRPATIPTGGEGAIVARASNLGDATTTGASELSLTLPEHVSVVEEGGEPKLQFYRYNTLGGEDNRASSLCSLSGQTVTCVTELADPAAAYQVFVKETLEKFGLPNEPPWPELVEHLFPRAAFEAEHSYAPLTPYEYIELRVAVKDEGATPGAPFITEASGGGA
jgi:hypothetical protein